METTSLPVVLAIGGHDPSGGAGIQADIESIAANGAHATSLLTCLTLQDSCNVQALHPVAPELLTRQAELLLADCRISAIKIGLLGSPGAAAAVAGLLQAQPHIPVVLDPVLAAGGGSNLAGSELLRRLREELLSHCDLITPNIPEVISLSGLDANARLDDCAHRLLEFGARAVLLTGTHESTEENRITHRFYRPNHPTTKSHWRRLPGAYHGSGCTLAASIAARLALGDALEEAVERALDFTWRSLGHAFRSGRCQLTPDRLFRLGRTPLADDE
ncbi:MAG: hydroxymethylpyrimidine/phosphomethylpyrimidine kinase [Candidatus Thiodiazotropha sp.]